MLKSPGKRKSGSDRFPLKPTRENKTYSFQPTHPSRLRDELDVRRRRRSC